MRRAAFLIIVLIAFAAMSVLVALRVLAPEPESGVAGAAGPSRSRPTPYGTPSSPTLSKRWARPGLTRQ